MPSRIKHEITVSELIEAQEHTQNLLSCVTVDISRKSSTFVKKVVARFKIQLLGQSFRKYHRHHREHQSLRTLEVRNKLY